jgi:hypothetical protein
MKIVAILASAGLFSVLTTAQANAYQFFTNRDSWNNAILGKN